MTIFTGVIKVTDVTNKPPAISKEVRVDLGEMRDAMKVKCARLKITMKAGYLQACALWLKAGRR